MTKRKAGDAAHKDSKHPSNFDVQFVGGAPVCPFMGHDHPIGDEICYQGQSFVCQANGWQATGRPCAG